MFTWLHCSCYDGEKWGDTYLNLGKQRFRVWLCDVTDKEVLDGIISNFHGLLSCLGHVAVLA